MVLAEGGACSPLLKMRRAKGRRLHRAFAEGFDGSGEGGEDARVGGVEDELTFAAAGDEAGFGEDFQMVGDSGGSDATEFDQ